MSDKKRSPVFLERQSYRRRRLIDTIRMLPLIGFFLWIVPILWPNGSKETAEPVMTSEAIIYLFGCWLVMVLLCFALSRALQRSGLAEAGLDSSADGET